MPVDQGMKRAADTDPTAASGPGRTVRDHTFVGVDVPLEEPADPLADRRWLERIADACERFTPLFAIAPSRRFYAGGGASVRGYGYQDIGPRDPNGAPVGGRSLTEFSIEARVRAFGNFGIVPFLDAGNIYTSALPKLSDMRFGTGLGLRYYSNFGPIRIDVGTPIRRRPGEPRVAVYVSLGQAF